MRTRFVALVVLGLLAYGAAWAGPSIVIEPATFDWGRQAENKGEYTYTFTVKNVGDEELQITRVRPGCSCTKVELKKQNLAPGESTEMTGGLTTKGTEGAMQKGIILTTNDPQRPTAIASLAIRFAINGQGLRLKGSPVAARLRQDGLFAYAVVENCEPETEIQIQALELPAGWDSPLALPVTVKPEDRATVTLTRKVGGGEVVEAFDALPFTLVTDSAKTPRVEGALSYRPDTRAATGNTVTDPQVAASGARPVRWPMAKPAPRVAPITAPPATPPATPPVAPAASPTEEPQAKDGSSAPAADPAAPVPAAAPAP